MFLEQITYPAFNPSIHSSKSYPMYRTEDHVDLGCKIAMFFLQENLILANCFVYFNKL